ncbi:MAG: hypothetical protein GX657_11445 [Chloroflexi bacterium]|nr:hypothetical protein [Chloroflexota bacterium]
MRRNTRTHWTATARRWPLTLAAALAVALALALTAACDQAARPGALPTAPAATYTPATPPEAPTAAPTALPTVLPTASAPPTAAPAETRLPSCAPPLCAPGEVLHCPGECPGGCGVVCATPEPLVIAPQVAPALVVAYEREGALWAAIGPGAPRLVAGAEGGRLFVPLLSPDGRRVLYRRGVDAAPGATELWVVETDPGSEEYRGPRRVASGAAMDAAAPREAGAEGARAVGEARWLADGRRFAFSTVSEGLLGALPTWDLWLGDARDGSLLRYLPEGQGGRPFPAPIGDLALLSEARSATLVDLGGGPLRKVITFPAVNTASEWAWTPRPTWLPDGSAALVPVTSAEPFAPGASCALWRVSREGQAAQIGSLPVPCLGADMMDRLWSPGEGRLAYLDEASGALLVADGDGSNAQTLATGVSEFLGWAPEGRRLAYRAGGRAWLNVDTPGAEAIPLGPEEAGEVFEARWPGGAALVASAGLREAPTLWVLGEEGGPRVVDSRVTAFAAGLYR